MKPDCYDLSNALDMGEFPQPLSQDDLNAAVAYASTFAHAMMQPFYIINCGAYLTFTPPTIKQS
ncbi:MAG: hypothetical protein ACTHKB_15680 [Burkholderiaceae bacterium]